MLSSRNMLMLTGLGAVLATVVLFAGFATDSGGDRVIPVADAQPVRPLSPATTTSTTSTTAAASDTDERGFVDSDARCDEGQVAVAVGRTQRSKVAICTEPDGGYEYRGVRISDGASLVATAESTGDGAFVALNDGAQYSVSPTELVVTVGGKVIYRDTWVVYESPESDTEMESTVSTTPTTAAR